MSSLDEMLLPNRRALQVLGLWPGPFVHLRLVLAVVGLASLIGPQLYSVGYYWGDIAYLTETGSISLAFALLLLKFLYAIVRHREFARMQHNIELFWRASDEAVERKCFETPARIACALSIVALMACLADFAAFVGEALIVGRLQNRRLLPLDVVYGFDYQDSGMVFASLFVAQIISMWYLVASAVGIDATALTAIIHLIGQFRLVNYRLRVIGANRQPTTTTFAKCLVRCIAHHQLVVDVADSLSKLISPMVFGQLLCSGVQVCISGYAIIEGTASVAVVAKSCVVMVSLLLQLAMWYVPGDFLDEESGRVSATVYHEIPWLELSRSMQRDLLFVMARAQKTCKVVALYQTTSIAQLTDVFKTAGSYMALLRSFKQYVADWLSNLISPMVFGQLLCSGLQICISGYAIIDGSAVDFVLVKCILFFSSILIQLAMWYVPRDFLDEESGRVAETVCHELPWFELPMSLQRDLLFVMMRAQKTCKVVAMYQTTSIDKLTDAFKAAGSYMTLLRSMKH